ncbi:uncharacterized protein KY384_000707 [Bacidia gigantensis]|uniref:uncharacterized protein n=1 Tax=Bacidia gigantensis TaxID=2732470 RepID=UPI001D059E24|nr:uncharacterized protein KY384_000707 [Bacidia gigantensis]KAG8525945.1 hypothetical protein KY384_000707 [Bacidia gigantensis]
MSAIRLKNLAFGLRRQTAPFNRGTQTTLAIRLPHHRRRLGQRRLKQGPTSTKSEEGKRVLKEGDEDPDVKWRAYDMISQYVFWIMFVFAMEISSSRRRERERANEQKELACKGVAEEINAGAKTDVRVSEEE